MGANGTTAVHDAKPRGGGWYELPSGEKVRGRELHLRRQLNLAIQSLAGGRSRFLSKAGLAYGGKRDVYATAGYVPAGQEKFENYWGWYERDPLGARIVDMPCRTTWKTPPEVTDTEPETETVSKFQKAFEAFAKRSQLWRRCERVDRLARIGRYGVLLIGARGVDSQLTQPLPRLRGPQDILYLQGYHEGDAKIMKLDEDPQSERFGLPTLYEILFASSGSRQTKGLVHWSRVIHVAEDPLQDEVYGRPALKRALNVLTDLLKVTASTGEAYWQLASRILQLKIDAANVESPTETQLDALEDSMTEIVHDLRRQFVGQGTELGWLESTTPDPSKTLELYQGLVAVASGIPRRILFGSERGELASEQDERNYFGTINERQELHAEPMILRALIDRLVSVNALPPPQGGDYLVVWPTLFEESETQIAEANLKRAQTASTLTPVGGDPLDLVEIDDNRNVWIRKAEDIEALRKERQLEVPEPEVVPPPAPEDDEGEPPPTGGEEPAPEGDGTTGDEEPTG